MFLSLRDIDFAEEDRRVLARYGVPLLPCPVQDVQYRTTPIKQPASGGILLTSPKAALSLPAATEAPCPIFCVGRRTARLARNKGYHDIWVGTDSAASLAEEMKARQLPKRLLWLRGEKVSFNFASAFAGITKIEEQICYDMVARDSLPQPVETALKAGQVTGIMAVSIGQIETFDHLLDKAQLSKWRADCPLFVISPRLASAAPDWPDIVISRRKRPVSVRASIICYDRRKRMAIA